MRIGVLAAFNPKAPNPKQFLGSRIQGLRFRVWGLGVLCAGFWA